MHTFRSFTAVHLGFDAAAAQNTSRTPPSSTSVKATSMDLRPAASRYCREGAARFCLALNVTLVQANVSTMSRVLRQHFHNDDNKIQFDFKMFAQTASGSAPKSTVQSTSRECRRSMYCTSMSSSER